MRFEHPEYLLGLFIIPLVFIVARFAHKNYRIAVVKSIGAPILVEKLISQIPKTVFTTRLVLTIFGIVFLIIAISNPTLPKKEITTKQLSADIIIALDISNSMRSRDVSPSRLTRAQLFCEDLIKELGAERIGSILFAGSAYLQMPLTTDFTAALQLLSAANPNQISDQGTALGEAINLASTTFGPTNSRGRALIIITDGEDHDSEAIAAAKKARENNVLIYTVGIGTPNGGEIPMGDDLDAVSKRDEKGNLIISKLNPSILTDIANAANGSYLNLSETRNAASSLKNAIDNSIKKDWVEGKLNVAESLYAYFLIPALFCFLIEILMRYKINYLKVKKLIQVQSNSIQ